MKQFAFIALIVLLSATVSASHYYDYYGGFDYSSGYEREKVTISESESYHESWRSHSGNYHASNDIDYARSRTFSFEREAEYTNRNSRNPYSYSYFNYDDYNGMYSNYYDYPYRSYPVYGSR